jgi:hypothetical protein
VNNDAADAAGADNKNMGHDGETSMIEKDETEKGRNGEVLALIPRFTGSPIRF